MAAIIICFIVLSANLALTDRPVNKFKCLLLNARSICNKLKQFNVMLDSVKPACVAVTETWLNASVSDAMLDNSHNYNIYRVDRETRGGGYFL